MGADDFGVILILIGMAVFVAALVAMIRPLSRLWMPTRKAATVGLALSLGSCLLGGSLMPPPEKAVAKAGAETSKVATAAAPVEPKRDAKADARAGALATWNAAMAALQPCDDANSRMGKLVNGISNGGASIYDAYEAAKRGTDVCRETWSAIGDVEVDDAVSGDARADMTKGLDTCRDAYLFRQMALRSAQAIFNGDMRPSAVSEFKERASTADSGVLACVAGLMSGALKAGVDVKDLKAAS